MSISNLKKHNAQFEKMDAIASLTSTEGTPTAKSAKKTAPRVTRSMIARSPSPTASSCVSESTLVSIASTTAVKTPKKVGRRTSKASKKPKDGISEVISEINTSSILPETSESQFINETDVVSPASSIVSAASSVRYSTRKSEKKLLSSSKVDDTLDTPTTRKYNLRGKKGAATPHLAEEFEKKEKATPKLTRKPRVSRRVSKIAETNAAVENEIEEKVEPDVESSN